MKKTKVIATIGPSSKDKIILEDMIINGMDIARLNMKYASHEFCKDIIYKIKDLNRKLNTNIAIMLDLEGPDVTIGRLINKKVYLNEGDKIRVYMDDILGDSTKFSVSYTGLLNDVKTNTIIKLNDGLVEIKVLEKGFDYLLCEVIIGGYIEEYKSINVMNTKLSLPFLSKKDIEDIKFANEENVDFLALSFISSAEDVLAVNDMLIDAENDHISLISKIENERALDDLDEIIKVSDGIMIARGDLGVEIPLERVPGIQRTIINKCHLNAKISIVATEMLSMEESIKPTRAEVNDIASSIIDGVDVVMLSGETTIGKYPVGTLTMMYKIIESAENDTNNYELLDKAMRTEKQDTTGSIAYSVVECAEKLKCLVIVTPTMSGYTARKISRFRPKCPIFALTPNPLTAKSLAIYYGVYPILIDEVKSFDGMLKLSKNITRKMLNFDDGDKIIITGGYPFKEVKHTNFMKIEEL